MSTHADTALSLVENLPDADTDSERVEMVAVAQVMATLALDQAVRQIAEIIAETLT
jgi:hypothetical protein